MKYLFFISAVLGILPAVTILICERYLIRLVPLGLILPLWVFNKTAINFFSKEEYRGTSRGLEVSIIYIVAVILICTVFTIKGMQNPFPDRGSRLYLLYFLLCLPSLFNAGTLSVSIFELWKMVMIYLVFVAVYYYLKFSNGDFDIIMYGVGALTVINFFSMLSQHFSGIYQPRGIFPHQNSMAMFMMMAGTLFFARYFNNNEKWRSTLFFILFGMASVALVRTYSRGAIACYPLSMLIVLLFSLRYTFSIKKMYVTSALALIAVVGTLYFLPRVINRFQSAPKESGNTRKDLALVAKNMIVDKPIRGVGINNWGYAINPPYTYSDFRREARRMSDEKKDGIVETVYLLVAAECGLPCFFIFLCWLGYYWVISLRLIKKLKGSSHFYLPVGVFGGLTGVMLQSALEWVLKQQMNLIFLLITFAMLSYLNKHFSKFIAIEPTSEARSEPIALDADRTGA